MPGILPMKVIRVGSNAQSRIAQACDRCRSKKIRCDGIRPCCTQCSNVGFECKTSDKLSRRAFPRGYTESLEDRVRGLEAEVRDLKDLLDEKDEKIDMLSRIHSFSPHSRKCSESLSPAASDHLKSDLRSTSQEFLQIETPAPVGPSASSSNQSSTAAFIGLQLPPSWNAYWRDLLIPAPESFEHKVQESGKPCPDISPCKFLQPPPATSSSSICSKGASKIPPRLLSDQYINIFFQEWAPLLPVLHRPSFLRIYEDYLSDPEAGHWHSNKQAVAQLFLIFEIAALSSVSRIKQGTTSYEPQWRKALHSTSSTASVATLQCHVLAQLYYLLRADYSHLVRHRAIGVSICHQLGLHQNQMVQGVTALDSETRKKVFWSQYVLDKFTSAASGAPMLLRDADISTDYPKDVDDENITHQGLSPTLPGELTKISSALALFKGSRILAKTLEELYPASTTYQLSLKKLRALSDELDQWSQNLPCHLRLQFLNDKPSTGVVSCRSPLLSLAYFFTRSLIHRPLVCHGSGTAASTSILATADSAKHIVQILDLLDERRMNYTFPFNKSELLLTAGFSLLWQCLELPEESKLVKDNQKTLMLLIAILTQDSVSAGKEFQAVAGSFVNLGPRNGAQAPKQTQIDGQAAHLLDTMAAPEAKHKSPRKQLQAIASRFSSFNNSRVKVEEPPRRATVPHVGPAQSLSPYERTNSTLSLASTRSAPVMPMYTPPKPRSIEIPSNLNLDYLPIGEEDDAAFLNAMPGKGQLNECAWERLLTNIDSGHSSIYNGVYGGGSPSENGLQRFHTEPAVVTGHDWVQEVWHTGAIDLTTRGPVPQSVLSFSEESLTSGEDLVFSASGSNHGSTGYESMNNEKSFKGIAIPNLGEDFDFDEFDARF